MASVRQRHGLIDFDSERTRIPWYPYWPGLLANTTIYSTLFLLFLACLRAIGRRDRGACQHCNYPIAGHNRPICPECGQPVTQAPVSA